ncbi:MAG: cysteine synthase family protein [Myxococcota bacterium]
MQVLDSILESIGNTPIVKLARIGADLNVNLLVKCEFLNPGGSIKDRIGLYLVRQAEKEGLLKPGGTIVEATSGNTGLGLALAGARQGYKCIFVMPDKQSEDKRRLLRAVGAEVVICPTDVEAEDPRSYYQVAMRIAKETPNCFYANQYHNQDNPDAHYHSTGPEIWKQMGHELDVFITGIGTGGTVVGTSRFLKEKNAEVQIVGVDPVGSIYFDLFHHGKPGPIKSYRIEGIGEDFMPSTMNIACMNDVIQVGDEESFAMARRLIKEEGLLCGGSSGSAVVGAIKYIKERMPAFKRAKPNILVVLPDASNRYLSKFLSEA